MKILLTILLSLFLCYSILAQFGPPFNLSTPSIQSIGGGGTSSGGSGITNLPANALGGLWNDGVGGLSWLTAPAISGANISSGTIPRAAADATWAPVTNAIMTTNNPIASRSGQVPKMTGNTNTFGAPTAIITNLLMSDLEFHVATNAFTNVVVGYIGPLTNIDGFKFYIPIGTNLP